VIPDESEMVERTLYPLLPVIGPRHGRAVAAVMAAARSGDWRLLDDGRVTVGGLTLEPDEFQLTARARPGHEVAEEGDLLVALDTQLDDELAAEGLAREVAHRLQNLRKAAGYEISDRIVAIVGGDAAAVARLEPFAAWLADETLAVELRVAADAALPDADRSEEVAIEGATLRLALRRAA
jgi:isoleucyl-tRNA synthetase